MARYPQNPVAQAKASPGTRAAAAMQAVNLGPNSATASRTDGPANRPDTLIGALCSSSAAFYLDDPRGHVSAVLHTHSMWGHINIAILQAGWMSGWGRWCRTG
jgi:hypothetical protein